MTRAQRKIVDNELRDFRLGGAELPPDEKAEFKHLREQLDQLSSRFNDNLLDATNAFAHVVTDQAELAGMPEDVVEAAQAAATADGKDGLEVHAAHAVLSAGHAIRGQSRAARD